jgi:HAD superfamily hydrolase (TIGR01484 family)
VYFLALATDYDGTLAHNGVVEASTLTALERFKDTGRRLILVTGRELPHLKDAFPHLARFDCVVAENGALIYDPNTGKERSIAPEPSALFVRHLQDRGVTPLSVGRSLVATWEPHQATVLEVIRELGLELQIIFNKGAVMILPPGVNKAVGLNAALRDLELSQHNVVAVGDAENDHAMLNSCGCAATVANALVRLKESADIHLTHDHGAGVVELMERICREDAGIANRKRHGILLGADGREQVYLEPFTGNILIAGQSGIGKSTLATALVEKMAERHFEFCVFDPEGDYIELETAISVGDSNVPPTHVEVLKLLQQPDINVVINTQSLSVSDRPVFFAAVLPQLASLHARTGRPHWLLIDEAHRLLPGPRHLLPGPRKDVAQILPENSPATVFITAHPESVSPDALKSVNIIIALGVAASDVILQFCRAIDIPAPNVDAQPQDEEILVWVRNSGQPPRQVKPERPRQAHKRHTRKYAEGNLGEDRSFYFRGPANALHLRAQNLMIFLQLAEGLDQETWMHHLRSGDYSAWFRRSIKDNELAEEALAIEADQTLNASTSRQKIKDAVLRRYTAGTGDNLRGAGNGIAQTRPNR